MIARLSSELQLIVSRNVSEEDWNLDELLRVVEEEVVARERVSVTQTVKPRRDSKPPPSATTLVSDVKGVKQGCCYCDKDHSAASCDVVTEIDARKQILRKSGRCYSCLWKGHLSRDCRTTHRCHKCSGCHHTSICTPQQPQTADTLSKTTPVNTTNTLNPSAPEFNPSTANTTLYLEASKTVLLQTAVSEVYNPTDCDSEAEHKDHNGQWESAIILDGQGEAGPQPGNSAYTAICRIWIEESIGKTLRCCDLEGPDQIMSRSGG